MVSKAHFYNHPERDAVMAEEHAIINKSTKVKPYKRLVYKYEGGWVRGIRWWSKNYNLDIPI